MLTSFNGVAQTFSENEQNQIDSFSTIISNSNSHDTLLAGAYVGLSEILYVVSIDTLKFLCEKGKSIAERGLKKNPNKQEKMSLLKILGGAVSNIAYAYQEQGNISKSLEYNHISMKIAEEMGDKSDISSSLNNIGVIYKNQGNISKTLEYFHKSLRLREEINDKQGVATSLNNIGAVYQNQGDYTKGLEYYHKSLKIREEINDKNGIAGSLNNIGSVYNNQKDYPNALLYYNKALRAYENIGFKSGIGISLNNIGSVYRKQKDIDNALSYFYKSLEVYEKIGYKNGITFSLNNIGIIALQKGNVEKAHSYAQRSIKISQELGFPINIKGSAKLLSSIYEKQGNGIKALEMHKLYVRMKDSINNEETQKATIRQQTKYEFEKAQIVKENEAKEQARILAEANGRRDNLQYSFIFLGILVLFGGVLSLGFIKVSPNVAEGLIFFAFLILFEFILVFADPYLGNYTNDEPIYNLLANALIALLIFPLHAILEKVLKKRIVKQ